MDSSRPPRVAACVLAAGFLVCASASALAMVSVAIGNGPVENRDWPPGSEKVANLASRLAHWAGPMPGESHFEYRCKDTAEFNAALELLAAIRTPPLQWRTAIAEGGLLRRTIPRTPELVVHDGPKYSSVLGAGRKAPRKPEARVDWSFVVWQASGWHRSFGDPKTCWNSATPNFRQPAPPPRIDVYVGGGAIQWDKVRVPAGVTVIDRRAESPVGPAAVAVYDMATSQPVSGAQVELVQYAHRKQWRLAAKAKTDATGCARIGRTPPGRYRLRVRAQGYASRDCGAYHWPADTRQGIAAQLLAAAGLKGVVVDTAGNPVAGACVSARSVLGIDGQGYRAFEAKPAVTDADGRFEITGLPGSYASLRCRAPNLHTTKPMYELHRIPSKEGVLVVMEGTGVVRGRVVGPDGKPPRRQVHVHIDPPGRSRVGQWGGAMRCKPDGRFEFTGVPPGEYELATTPRVARNGESSRVVTATVTAGQTVDVTVPFPPGRSRPVPARPGDGRVLP